MAKARLRYESLLAENQMTEGIRFFEEKLTFFGRARRAVLGMQQAFRAVSQLSGFFQRLFGKSSKEEKPEEDNTVYY